MTSTTPDITMYSTTWCGYCRNLAKQLRASDIGFETVNIEQDPAAADFVESVNGGNRTVPTVRIATPDGGEVVLTNPSLAQVKQAAGLA